MDEKLPAMTEGARQTAMLASGIGTALAALWYPPVALAQPIINLLIEKYTKRPERILLARIRAGKIDALTDEQVAEFVPMAYRFFEAAREGEYEHNLRILGEYIANELKQPKPEAAGFLHIARKLEGISKIELQIIALSDAAMTEIDAAPDQTAYIIGQAHVSATALHDRESGSHGLSKRQITDALNDLAARGLLIPDGATRLGKAEEYYFRSSSFIDLIKRARSEIVEATSQSA